MIDTNICLFSCDDKDHANFTNISYTKIYSLAINIVYVSYIR